MVQGGECPPDTPSVHCLPDILLISCECMHLQVHVCVCAGTRVCMSLRLEADVAVFLNHSLVQVLRQGLSLKLELPVLLG